MLALSVLAAAFVVLMALNLTVFVKGLRQWWLIRRLRLKEQFEEVRAGRPQRRRWSRYLTLGLGLLSLLSGSFVLVLWFVIKPEDSSEHLILAIALATFIAPGSAWLAQRCQERLEVLSDLDRLTHLLSRSEPPSAEDPEGGRVVLPAAALTRIAQIERAQISRDRVEALLEARSTAAPAYAVLKSAAAQSVLRSLDLTARLHVEDRIQDLTTEPPATAMRPGDPPDVFRTVIDNTSLSLLCQIDREARRITVVDIANDTPDSGDPKSGAPSRA